MTHASIITMPLALGLVETNGLIAAIEAADAMAKASAVKLIGKEKINPALVTIKVVGEVAAVKASVEAGAAAAARVGIVVSTHIIPRPDAQLAALYPEILDEPIDTVEEAAVPEETVNSVEQPTEILSTGEAVIEETLIEVEAEHAEEVAPPDIPIADETVSSVENVQDPEPVPAIEPSENPDDTISDEVPEVIDEYPDEDADPEYISDILGEDEVFPDDIVFEEQEYHYEEIATGPDVSEITDPDNYPISDEFESLQVEESEQSETAGEAGSHEQTVLEPEEPELSEEESLEIQQAYAEVFSDQGVEEEVFQPESAGYEDDLQGLLFEDLFAQAERLEKERKTKAKPETKSIKKDIPAEPVIEPVEDTVLTVQSQTELSEQVEALPEDSKPAEDEASENAIVQLKPEPEVLQDNKQTVENTDDTELDELQGKPLDSMNVHQLRRLARSTVNFPIQGREISKANRQELLYYFQSIR